MSNLFGLQVREHWIFYYNLKISDSSCLNVNKRVINVNASLNSCWHELISVDFVVNVGYMPFE